MAVVYKEKNGLVGDKMYSFFFLKKKATLSSMGRVFIEIQRLIFAVLEVTGHLLLFYPRYAEQGPI